MMLRFHLPGFLRQISFRQKLIDRFIRIPSAALVDCISAFSQRHCGDTIILCYNKVASPANSNQRKVNRVRTCANGPYLRIRRCQNMICIAKQDHRNPVLLGDPFCNTDDRAGVRINQNIHGCSDSFHMPRRIVSISFAKIA